MKVKGEKYINNKIKKEGSPGKIQGSNYCDAEMQK